MITTPTSKALSIVFLMRVDNNDRIDNRAIFAKIGWSTWYMYLTDRNMGKPKLN